MTIRGKRRVRWPGGRWYIWAMHHNRILGALATNETEWMEILNAYRCKFPVLNARPV